MRRFGTEVAVPDRQRPSFSAGAKVAEMILTDFFLVKEPDSMLSEKPRHKNKKTDDMLEGFHADDETPKGAMDFHSTFLEVSHCGRPGSSETADQSDTKRPQGHKRGDGSLKDKTETDTRQSGNDKKIAESITGKPAHTEGKNRSDSLSAQFPRATATMTPAHADGEHLRKPGTARTGSSAIRELKEVPVSAESGSSKNASVLSETPRVEGHLRLAHHHMAVRDPHLRTTVASIRTRAQDGTEAATKERHDPKAEIPGIREKGTTAPAAESGLSRGVGGHAVTKPAKGKFHDVKTGTAGVKANGTATPAERPGAFRGTDGLASTETAKRERHDLKGEMPGIREKGTATPAAESGSSRSVDGQTVTETAKGRLHDVKTEMPGVKAKEAAIPVERPGAFRSLDGLTGSERGKTDGAGSRGVFGFHGIRLSDQGFEQTGLKTHSSELLAHRDGATVQSALSALEKELSQKNPKSASKKETALTEMTSKSTRTRMQFKKDVDEGRETGKGRHGKDVSRFKITRDGQVRGKAIRAGAEEQTDETKQGKSKTHAPVTRLAARPSSPSGEHGVDRGAPKSETNMTGNTTVMTSPTPLSTKTSRNVSRLADTEMVRRSFQENGLRQLVEKAALHVKNGQPEFRIELKPELLGQVKVQVSTENHQVTIRIVTELPVAKEIIENNLHQLRVDLQGHGLEIDKVEVSLSQGSDKNGVEHGFSGSKKMRRGYGQKRASNSVSSIPEMEREDWVDHRRSGSSAINLFA